MSRKSYPHQALGVFLDQFHFFVEVHMGIKEAASFLPGKIDHRNQLFFNEYGHAEE